jgi:uncharacterized protein (DUF697 family)
MTRKQLPKAIKPAGSSFRFVPGEAGTEAPLPQSVTAKPTTPKESVQVEAEVWPPAPPPANDSLPVKPSPSEMQAEQRLREAFRIVERHKFYSGLGGLIPLPAVNVAGVTAVNLRMVKRLCDLYGVAFEWDKNRSIVIGIMGGAAPSGLAAATAATLPFAIPVAGAVALAVSTVTATALTRRIGLHFIERFERHTVG